MIDLEGAQEVYVIEKKVIAKGTVDHYCCHCEKLIAGRKVKIVAQLVFYEDTEELIDGDEAMEHGASLQEAFATKVKQFFLCIACWRAVNETSWRAVNETKPLSGRVAGWQHPLMRV